MNGNSLKSEIKNIVSTLNFAWIQTKPSMIHAHHRLALKSSDKTSHISPEYDIPVQDLVSKTVIRPSVMQGYLEYKAIPSILPYIQALAEDSIQEKRPSDKNISQRIESLVHNKRITRELASKAHYWRIVRNIIAHGSNKITKRTESEVNKLFNNGDILFRNFVFWGPLIYIRSDDQIEGSMVPLTDEAVASPQEPNDQCFIIDVTDGETIAIGLADLLAAAEVWAEVIDCA